MVCSCFGYYDHWNTLYDLEIMTRDGSGNWWKKCHVTDTGLKIDCMKHQLNTLFA